MPWQTQSLVLACAAEIYSNALHLILQTANVVPFNLAMKNARILVPFMTTAFVRIA